MNNTCTICGQNLSQIPAGVSKKTGKPYNAFMACPNKCQQNNYPQAPVQQNVPISPVQPQNTVQATTQPPVVPVKTTANDIRENVVLKMISELVSAGKIQLDQWESWANNFYYYEPKKEETNNESTDIPMDSPF